MFQISTLADQKNSDNPNVSSIDLGECEKALKDKFGINEDLIVFKTDIKSEDLTQTYVQYEIYDPRDLTQLNLTICKDMKISVSTPVKLDSSTSSLYDLLKDSGYDLFNESSDFYTDICSTFTSQNGTDMTLEDRKKEIFSTSANLYLCQSGCELESYNSTTRKAKCECSPQTEEVEISLSSSNNKFDVKKVGEGFMNTLKNSNFLVLKCYKLAIDLTTLWTNKGRILMTIILLLTIIVLIAFCFTGNKKINHYLDSIISFTIQNNKDKGNSKDKKDKNTKQKNNKDKEKETNKNRKNEENNKGNNNLSKNRLIKINSKNKRQLKNKQALPPKKINLTQNKGKSNILKTKDFSMSSKMNLKKDLLKKNKNKPTPKNNSTINIIRIGSFNIRNSD